MISRTVMRETFRKAAGSVYASDMENQPDSEQSFAIHEPAAKAAAETRELRAIWANTVRRVLNSGVQVSPDDAVRDRVRRESPLWGRKKLAQAAEIVASRGYLRTIKSFSPEEHRIRGLRISEPLDVYVLSDKGAALLSLVDETA